MKTPITNHTRLNTALFTFLSSGSINVIMYDYPDDKLDNKKPPYRTRQNLDDKWWEWGPSINYWPPSLDPDKEANLFIGDRDTLFLNQLYTNYFFIDLDYLAVKRTVHVKFTTTKDYSFSLTRKGNRNPMWNGKTPANGMNLRLLGDAKKWGYGTVRNLEKFFEGYRDDKVLEFNFSIYKPNSYTLVVGVGVVDPDPDKFNINYHIIDPDDINYRVDTEIATQGTPYEIKNWPTDVSHEEHIFNGWNTESNGSGDTYLPGETYLINSDIDLYPIWTAIEYTTIRFISNDGAGSSYTLLHRADDPYTIPSYEDMDWPPPSPGWEFSQWNTSADGSGTSYHPGDIISTADMLQLILYAQWTYSGIYYTVSYSSSLGQYHEDSYLMAQSSYKIKNVSDLGWTIPDPLSVLYWMDTDNNTYAFTDTITVTKNLSLNAVFG